MLQKDLVTLGLYRLPGANDNKYPYVYSNPNQNVTITMKDRVFVLGKKITPELTLDYNLDEDMVKEQQMKKQKQQVLNGELLDANLIRNKATGLNGDLYGTDLFA